MKTLHRLHDGSFVQVAKWEKTGGWHYAFPHVPTQLEREIFPKSYPPGDDGPFYRWADCGPLGFETEEEALAHARSEWMKRKARYGE